MFRALYFVPEMKSSLAKTDGHTHKEGHAVTRLLNNNALFSNVQGVVLCARYKIS